MCGIHKDDFQILWIFSIYFEVYCIQPGDLLQWAYSGAAENKTSCRPIKQWKHCEKNGGRYP